eukprot:gene21992-biopygen7717
MVPLACSICPAISALFQRIPCDGRITVWSNLNCRYCASETPSLRSEDYVSSTLYSLVGGRKCPEDPFLTLTRAQYDIRVIGRTIFTNHLKLVPLRGDKKGVRWYNEVRKFSRDKETSPPIVRSNKVTNTECGSSVKKHTVRYYLGHQAKLLWKGLCIEEEKEEQLPKGSGRGGVGGAEGVASGEGGAPLGGGVGGAPLGRGVGGGRREK